MEYVFVFSHRNCKDITMLPLPPERDKRKTYILQAIGLIANALYYLKSIR